MSKIHFVGGEKGGVGKSVVARLLTQFCLDRSMPFSAIDADRSHGALMRFYNDFSRSGDLDNFETTDHIMQLALESDRRVIVDLPAQSDRLLTKWIEKNGILELGTEYSIPIVFWHVMDDGKDSIELLQSLLSKYDNMVRYVIVKNMGRGGDFTAFENSKARKLIDEVGAKIMTLDELHKPTMLKIDAQNKSFWQAINNTGGDDFGIIERHRIKVWLRSVYKEFDRMDV